MDCNDNRGTVALARRLYLHLLSGANITHHDMAILIEGMERTDAEIARLRAALCAHQLEAGTQRLLADRYGAWLDGSMIGIEEQAKEIERLRAALTASGIPEQAARDQDKAAPLRVTVRRAREIMEGLDDT